MKRVKPFVYNLLNAVPKFAVQNCVMLGNYLQADVN
jgi:hypothetical protein